MCDSDARTVQYELVVRKLAEHLVTLEVEQNFLSTESNRAKLPKILGQILSDINRCGLCFCIHEISNRFDQLVPQHCI